MIAAPTHPTMFGTLTSENISGLQLKKTSNWIDINLCLEDDLCRLRIRDNGVNFNPLEYQYDSEDFDIHGIELVKKVSKSMDYIRAIDMNNTIISF